MAWKPVFMICAALMIPSLLLAQDRDEEIEELKKRVEELERQIEEILDSQDEQIELLEEQLERQKRELERKISEATRLASTNALNPRITMFANSIGRLDDRTVISPEGDAIDDRFIFRAGEFELRGAIDPYAEAFLAVPFEAEAPGGALEGDIEEGYLILKRLPILEKAPAGLKLKIGKFRPDIGKDNRIHFHDLMWTTRPLAVATFLGTEGLGVSGEAGFQAIGINADFFLPSFPRNAVMSVNLGVGTASELAVIEDNDGEDPIVYVHPSWFHRPGEATSVEVGLSYLRGANDRRGRLATNLYALDFTYMWKPLEGGQTRSFVAGGELFAAGLERERGASSTPLGFYLFGQFQIDWHLYAGVRYDWTQELADEDIQTQVWAGYLSYFTSEFLRFRLGYEHRVSDIAEQDNRDSLFFEANLVFGAHPPEPYWVRR